MRIFVFALVLLMVGGCTLLPKEEEELIPPLNAPAAIAYKTEAVQRKSIVLEVKASGNIQPTKQNYVTFGGITGRLDEIVVSVGQVVEKGALVARLKREELENTYTVQKLQNQKAVLNLEKLENEQDKAKKDLEKRISDAKLHLENAQLTLQSLEMPLASTKTEADQIKIEQQKNTVKLSEASLNQLEAQLEALSSNKTKNFEIEQAKLDLELSNHALQQTEQKLKSYELYSPIRGQVTYIAQMKTEEYVDSYKTLATVSDLDSLKLFVSSSSFTGVPLNGKVKVTFSGKDYEGIVESTPINLPPEIQSVTKDLYIIQVEGLVFTEEDLGKSCTVIYEKERSDNAIVIDRSNIKTISGRRFVMVLEDGLAVERDIETGVMSNSEVEITKGLEEGDLVIQ